MLRMCLGELSLITRQAIFEKAHPDALRCADNVTFFTRTDYCHVTVERRWRLRQLIKSFQEREGEAFLLAPARLKTVINGKIKIFTSDLQAKEYLMELKVQHSQKTEQGPKES
ncbi:hypothetical protein NDU88_005618 [Pleurodeles waltl]|uniref:Uncharacterized protein n=1 Tax=Pleurodeles waltl TaxID=8319 RepID=A0AAV7PGG3_PLEWA|nr:hypothetical protein NDU88_005618 [Pleurodeles waltl]